MRSSPLILFQWHSKFTMALPFYVARDAPCLPVLRYQIYEQYAQS